MSSRPNPQGAEVLRYRDGAWFVTSVFAVGNDPERTRVWYRAFPWDDTLREALRDGAPLSALGTAGIYRFDRGVVRIDPNALPVYSEQQPIPAPRGKGWTFRNGKWRRGNEERSADLTWNEAPAKKKPAGAPRKSGWPSGWPYRSAKSREFGWARVVYTDVKNEAGRPVPSGTVLPIRSVQWAASPSGRQPVEFELGERDATLGERVRVQFDAVEPASRKDYQAKGGELAAPAPKPAPVRGTVTVEAPAAVVEVHGGTPATVEGAPPAVEPAKKSIAIGWTKKGQGVMFNPSVPVVEGPLPDYATAVLKDFATRGAALRSAAARDGFAGFVWHQPGTGKWWVVEGEPSGVRANPAKPTDLNLRSLLGELDDHAARHGAPEPLFEFSPARMAAMRKMVAAGYLEQRGARGRVPLWYLTDAGRAALDDYRARTAPRANPAQVVRPADGGPVVHVDATAGGLVTPAVLDRLVVTLADGRQVRFNRAGKAAKDARLTYSIDHIVWIPLRRGGKWNEAVRNLTRGKAGVYAIREHGAGKTALYVGMGGTKKGTHGSAAKASPHPERLYKTILRHFQEGFHPEKYASGELLSKKHARWKHGRKSAEIAYATWDRGERFRGGKEWTYHKKGDLDVALYLTPPSKAYEAEGVLIAELDPVQQGEKAVYSDDTSFDPDSF